MVTFIAHGGLEAVFTMCRPGLCMSHSPYCALVREWSVSYSKLAMLKCYGKFRNILAKMRTLITLVFCAAAYS